MRSDIVPGDAFPDYELPDHTTQRRKLSQLHGQHQWFSSSAAEVSVLRNAGNMKALFSSIVNSRLAITGLSRLALTILPRRMSFAPESAPIGLSSPIRRARSKKISTSPSIQIRTTNR